MGSPGGGAREGAGGGDPGPPAGDEVRTRLMTLGGGQQLGRVWAWMWGPGVLQGRSTECRSVGWTGSRISSDCMGWEWALGGQGWKQRFGE